MFSVSFPKFFEKSTVSIFQMHQCCVRISLFVVLLCRLNLVHKVWPEKLQTRTFPTQCENTFPAKWFKTCCCTFSDRTLFSLIKSKFMFSMFWKIAMKTNLANIYLFEVIKRNTCKRYEICPKLTKTSDRGQ